MKTKKLQENLKSLTDDLFKRIESQLKDKIESLTLVGSYASNSFSFQRPDINFHVIFNERVNSQDYLTLGEILSNTVHKYEDTFTVRLEYRPFKFPNPYGSTDKFEVFLNPIVNSILDVYGDYPLNMPKNVLAGMQATRKVVFGRDVLGDIKTDIDKGYVVKTSFRDLGLFRTQLKYAALSYDLSKPAPNLMNEAACIGKMILRLGLEIASTEKELKEKTYLKYLKDLHSMEEFYKNRYGKNIAKSAKIVLDTRDHYDEWKSDKDKIYDVYTAAHNIGEATWKKLLELSKN